MNSSNAECRGYGPSRRLLPLINPRFVTFFLTSLLVALPASAQAADETNYNLESPQATFNYYNRFEPLGSERHFNDAWITQIGALLDHDLDGDRYFTRFILSIDADTRYDSTDVYATVSLQSPLRAREHLYTSPEFRLYGTDGFDQLRLEIDLVTDYETTEYNLFVDLFDAYDHRLLDGVNANDFTNLANLPLEAEAFDRLSFTPPPAPQTENPNIRVTAQAGSNGIISLSVLLLFLAFRRGLRYPDHRRFVSVN